MQVLTPMTLYSNGRSITVYAPSTLSPTPPAGGGFPPSGPPLPPSIGIPNAPAAAAEGWNPGAGPLGSPGTFHLSPMPPGGQIAGQPAQFTLTPPLPPAVGLSGPLHLAPPSLLPASPPLFGPGPVAPIVVPPIPATPGPMGTLFSGVPPQPQPPPIVPNLFSIPAPTVPVLPAAPPPVVASGPVYSPPPLPVAPAVPYTAPYPVGLPVLGPQAQISAAGYRLQELNTGTNLYISNLPDRITKEGLKELFSAHGTVMSCRVARKQGQSPIGFVQYTTSGMAQAAVTAMNGMMVDDGRFIRVKLADHDKDKGVTSRPSSDLYICNLPDSWSYAELHSTFARYGKVYSLTMFKDSETGGNIGSGMVRYSSTAEATAAIQGLNMLQLPGMDRPIEVKYAESRAEKDRRVANRMDNEEEDQPLPQPEPPRWNEYQWQPTQRPPPAESSSSGGGSSGQLATPPNVPAQDMAAVQAFSRIMNLNATTGNAKQSLMCLNNGLQLRGEVDPAADHTDDTEVSAAEDYSNPPGFPSRKPGKGGGSLWDRVQGVLPGPADIGNEGPQALYKGNPQQAQPPTQGNPEDWGGPPMPSGVFNDINKDNNSDNWAWRGKRRPRRAAY